MSSVMASNARLRGPSENKCGAEPRRSGRRSGPPARRAGRPSERAGASAAAGGAKVPAVRGRPGVGAGKEHGLAGDNQDAGNIVALCVGGEVDHVKRLPEDEHVEHKVDHGRTRGRGNVPAAEAKKIQSVRAARAAGAKTKRTVAAATENGPVLSGPCLVLFVPLAVGRPLARPAAPAPRRRGAGLGDE